MQESEIEIAFSLLNLYQTQYAQVDKFWDYFGTVSLALVAFVIGSEKATRSMKEAFAIVFGYLVFCLGNFTGLLKAQQLLNQYADEATKAIVPLKLSLDKLNPTEPMKMGLFYWAVVLAVSGGILWVTHWRNTENSATQL